MDIQQYDINQEAELLRREESHFLDFKRSNIAPGKLQETIVAFANADGGEVIVGLDDDVSLPANKRFYGFSNPEKANNHVTIPDVLISSARRVP